MVRTALGARGAEWPRHVADGGRVRGARPARAARGRTPRRDPSPRAAPMRTLVSFSRGKDSAWMVHVLRQTPGVELGGLLTTVNAAAGRVAMHAVRETLLRMQADALGLPLQIIHIPSPCPNDVYEQLMGDAVRRAV